MQKFGISIVAFLCLMLASTAQSQGIPANVNLRYSAQLSNGNPGVCGCFTLQGVAGDIYVGFGHSKKKSHAGVGLVADFGYEHTANVNGVGYGLSMTTMAAGPRFVLPRVKRLQPFVQALGGYAHGFSSAFPQGNTLVPTASSYAVDGGGGADVALNKHVSLRILQVDFMRTALPNNTTDWQNNLRMAAGLTFNFGQ